MIKYENECVNCASPCYPCSAPYCKNLNVPRGYCDRCTSPKEDLYYYNKEQLCIDCIIEDLERVIVE